MRKWNSKWTSKKRLIKSKQTNSKFHQCIYTMDWDNLLWKCQGIRGCKNYREGQQREENIKQLRQWGFDE